MKLIYRLLLVCIPIIFLIQYSFRGNRYSNQELLTTNDEVEDGLPSPWKTELIPSTSSAEPVSTTSTEPVLTISSTEPVPTTFKEEQPNPTDVGTLESLIGRPHPIPEFLKKANETFHTKKLEKEKFKDLTYAREDYKKRYNLEPPRGFDRWHSFAVSQLINQTDNIIDYDAIMENLLPFRAIHPKQLRKRMWLFNREHMQLVIIKIKDSKRGKQIAFGNDNWIFKHMDKFLDDVLRAAGPDQLKHIEMVFNFLDEPRSLVNFEAMDRLRKAAQLKQYAVQENDPPAEDKWFHEEDDKELGKYEGDPVFRPRPVEMMTLWRKTRDTCPIGSPSRNGTIDPQAGLYFPWERPQWKYAPFPFAVGGFVKNFTQSLDLCIQNDMQAYHGMTIRPSTTYVLVNDLFPIFSGCSMSGYNDILIPSPHFHYELRSEEAMSKKVGWEEKKPLMIWRGSSTGAHSKVGDWRGVQRGRLVCRLNRRDNSNETVLVDTFEGVRAVNISAKVLDKLADVAVTQIWHADGTAFNDMKNTPCFRMTDGIPFDTLPEYRYLLDTDGNSFSSRFQQLLRMNSTVIKAQMAYEWYTSSIVPWYHYVPMNIRYSDTYDLVTWFEGFKSILNGTDTKGMDVNEAIKILDEGDEEGREQAQVTVALSAESHLDRAEAIARQGVAFAAGNLRQVDTVVFLYRVLIEWEEILDIGGKGGDVCDFGC
ncbi:capsule-associated protein CAP1 [Planoprotostelium fungivorum]|uniref:Capsule-associated protein CAP1 n=1 Tax=Planoprotostelium fungivorum TaxID=1890364 RepID=A0A2P6MXF0_9EUKA|nr:capsule-associated protein CAP1 [Planoprotostelium fungivorum]